MAIYKTEEIQLGLEKLILAWQFYTGNDKDTIDRIPNDVLSKDQLVARDILLNLYWNNVYNMLDMVKLDVENTKKDT
jgi:hypothetical protein